jgi:hypothetical protein
MQFLLTVMRFSTAVSLNSRTAEMLQYIVNCSRAIGCDEILRLDSLYRVTSWCVTNPLTPGDWRDWDQQYASLNLYVRINQCHWKDGEEKVYRFSHWISQSDIMSLPHWKRPFCSTCEFLAWSQRRIQEQTSRSKITQVMAATRPFYFVAECDDDAWRDEERDGTVMPFFDILASLMTMNRDYIRFTIRSRLYRREIDLISLVPFWWTYLVEW